MKLVFAFIPLYLIFCILLLALFVTPAYSSGPGTSGNSALRIGVGARATGMGEAAVAATGDVSSIYWNPAGLYRVRGAQISAMHIEWLDDIRYEWLAYAHPLTSWGTFAADISYIYMGSMVRTVESPTEGFESDGTFTSSDMAGRLGFGARVRKDILVGASLQILQSRVNFENVIREKISDKSSQSSGISFGCLYNTPVPKLVAGVSLQNLGRQTRAFIEKNESMPTIFRAGIAYRIPVTRSESQKSESNPSNNQPLEPIDSEKTAQPPVSPEAQISGLVLAMDLNYAVDRSLMAHVGAEYNLANGMSVRGGYRTGTGFDFPSRLSVGAGYSAASYQLDYAFIPYGNIGNTHRVSFTLRF